jgi:large subunit ribosomal protein L15
MQRKPKRKTSYRGHRFHGAGNAKNRRGAGGRGGRGNAGLCKHKFSWMVKNDPDHFGRFGFVRPNKKECMDTINLFDICQQALLGKLEKKAGKFYFEFDGKVLGSGELTVPVSIRANAWSKKTEEKVKKSGGEISKGADKKSDKQTAA